MQGGEIGFRRATHRIDGDRRLMREFPLAPDGAFSTVTSRFVKSDWSEQACRIFGELIGIPDNGYRSSIERASIRMANLNGLHMSARDYRRHFTGEFDRAISDIAYRGVGWSGNPIYIRVMGAPN